jgi:large subunit ribosomal protein L17e
MRQNSYSNGVTTPTMERGSPEVLRIPLPDGVDPGGAGAPGAAAVPSQEYASDEAEVSTRRRARGSNTASQAQANECTTQLEALSNRLLIERKIKAGAENLLSVFKLSGEKEGLRTQVEAELGAANLKIEALERRVDELQGILDGEARTTFAVHCHCLLS